MLEKIGDARRNAFVGQAREVMSRICLGIEINQQRSVTFGGTDSGKIAGDAGFANASLLIEYDTTHETCSSMKRPRANQEKCKWLCQFYDHNMTVLRQRLSDKRQYLKR
ncbi:hypothetical protein D9M73_258040 [compost metagenome]